MPGKENPSGPNPLADNYIVINKFYLTFFPFVARFWDIAQKCVAGFLFDPFFTPIGTLKNLNLKKIEINQFL